MMKINDVVTIVTIGGEFIGRLKSEDSNQIVLVNPRGLMQGEHGFGFSPGVCITGDTDDSVSFNRSLILFVVKTVPEIEKAWQKATSGIVI
jgi:hypothetical protein